MDEYATLDELLADVKPLGLFVNETIDHVLVTLGHHGVAVFRRTAATVPFFNPSHQYAPVPEGGGGSGRFYPAPKLARIVNVSGAGDSFTSGSGSHRSRLAATGSSASTGPTGPAWRR